MSPFRLSDLSDEELEGCLCTPSEVKAKEVLWTAMNQDYIDKQALKAATAEQQKVGW